MGFADMLAGDMPQAEQSFWQALETTMAEHIGTWHGLALSLVLQGRLDEAQALYEQTLEMDRNFAESHGGLAVVLTSSQPVEGAWRAGGPGIVLGLLLGVATIGLAVALYRRMQKGLPRTATIIAVLVGGFFLYRWVFDPAAVAVEANNPEAFGNIGGFGLPALVAWPMGGLLAAAAAWAIGKTALGLRSDYLAIATLGIAEIVIAVMKNEDWLARGVKNITQLPRPWPVPQEVELQQSQPFLDWAGRWGFDPSR
jgi:branched-chain amino acid transport system permease protein